MDVKRQRVKPCRNNYLISFLIAVSTLFFLPSAFAEVHTHAGMRTNMTQGVTPVSHSVYNLHMIAFWVCVGIGVIVFGVMLYILIYHRKSRGVKPAQFHEHTAIEIMWAIIPFIILVVMAIPATKSLLLIDDVGDGDINIKVTGYQWKWHYDYLGEGVGFFSNLATPRDQIENKEKKGKYYLLEVDKPLVVPINKKIRFLVTSTDVIHSWWVPDFGIKRDAVPGFIHESWATIEKPGIYRGQCAELCGMGHGFMPIVVEAKTQADYEKWLQDQKDEQKQVAAQGNKTWSKQELMQQGEKTYTKVCAVCHQPSGEGQPPAFPALKGSAIATGPVNDHINMVLHGKAGTAMQAFGPQLSDAELAAVITYERNAWGNDTGDLVQPSDIKKAKGTGEDTDAVASSQPAGPAVLSDAAIDKTYSRDELMKQGEDTYLGKCAACHQAGGEGMPPTFPGLKDSAIVNGPAAAHIHQVLEGKPGTAMVGFKSQLNELELAAVITYERNAWNGGKGGLVQPKQIQEAEQN